MVIGSLPAGGLFFYGLPLLADFTITGYGYQNGRRDIYRFGGTAGESFVSGKTGTMAL